MRKWLLLLVVLFLLVLAFTVAAQSGYDLSWWNIGGGGTSALGDYTLGGTVGQADAGPSMRGDNYDLTGGFQAVELQSVSAGGQTIYLPVINSQ